MMTRCCSCQTTTTTHSPIYDLSSLNVAFAYNGLIYSFKLSYSHTLHYFMPPSHINKRNARSNKSSRQPSPRTINTSLPLPSAEPAVERLADLTFQVEPLQDLLILPPTPVQDHELNWDLEFANQSNDL